MPVYDRSDAFSKLYKYLVQDRGYDEGLLQNSIYPETSSPSLAGWGDILGDNGVASYLSDLKAPLTQTGVGTSAANSGSLDVIAKLAQRLINMKTGQ